jgi:hypothetical protein
MGPQVHLTLTRAWAIEEGFSGPEADLIARADIGFDTRYPARASLLNITRHFAPTAWLWSARYLALAANWGDLMMLGYALHCAQDGVAHGRLGTRHLVQTTGLRPNPDVWETSPAGVRRRTEAVTRDRLRRFKAMRPV